MPNQDEVTPEDVVEASERVAELRSQVQAEEIALRQSEASRHLVVEKATLDAEANRLEAQLAALKDAREVSETSVEEDPLMRQIELGDQAAAVFAEEAAADAAIAAGEVPSPPPEVPAFTSEENS